MEVHVKFSASDLRPDDHLIWHETTKTSRIELIVLNVDHVNRTWTNLCLTNDHRPDQIGTIYTTPPDPSVDSWTCVFANAEILSRAKQ